MGCRNPRDVLAFIKFDLSEQILDMRGSQLYICFEFNLNVEVVILNCLVNLSSYHIVRNFLIRTEFCCRMLDALF